MEDAVKLMTGRSVQARMLFDAERDSPAIFQALRHQSPPLDELVADLRERIPLEAECVEGRYGQFYRLPNHYRSVCYALRDVSSPQQLHQSPVLVIKGSEPLLGDFEFFLDWMMKAQFRTHDVPMALHFPLSLRMPPGAVPIDEAMREQRVTSAFQSAHLATYGELAQAPVPLFVHEFTSEAVESYLSSIRGRLPGQALERIEGRVRAGLGIEIYYYDRAPIRAEDLATPSMWLGEYLPQFNRHDVEGISKQWIRGLARMLHLKYLPYASWNFGWGACVDAGNVCLNGGFVDLLTLVAFDTISDGRQMRAGLVTTIDLLSRSVGMLCAWAERWPPDRANAQLGLLLMTYVRNNLDMALDQELPRGQQMHEWIRSAIRLDSIDDLVAHARDKACHPIPYTGRLWQFGLG